MARVHTSGERWWVFCLFALAVALGLGASAAHRDDTRPTPGSDDRPLSFNRDVRPILSNHCYQCHGPDSAAREAGLRLDLRDQATAKLRSGARAIVPGKPDESQLLHRVSHPDPSEVMPPPEIGKPISTEQREILRRWIAAGAKYEKHWSFVPPVRPALPEVSDEAWCRTDIDRFVLARLDAEEFAPSEEAPPETLLRRASFDLTGLPPSPEDLDAFLNDDQSGAFERAIDRLLASDRYGEHMARHWLDAARYGDTHGLHLDNAREMWPWRDWVINAYNANMPFDQFTIEQLAGDLLPDATRSQILATGFHRNHVSTNEGGVITEEVRINNVLDRVGTTGTVWMGLTLSCAQCHEHKFDPISHSEFFELFAFFNSTTEDPLDGNKADWAPFVRVPSTEQQRTLDEMNDRVAEIEAALDGPSAEVDAAQEHWRTETAAVWSEGWHDVDIVEAHSEGGATLTVLDDGSVLASGDNPATDVYEIIGRFDGVPGARLIRLEALTHEDLPHTGPGRADNANFVLSEIELEVRDATDDGEWRSINLVGSAADHEQMNGPYPVAAAIDGIVDATNGWAVEGFERREDRVAIFAADDAFGLAGGVELRARLRFGTQYPQHAIGRVRLSVSDEEAIADVIVPVGMGTWHAVGPFVAGESQAAFENVAGPEAAPGAVNLAETFEGDLAWEAHPEWIDGQLHELSGEYCATYLTRTIHARRPGSMTLSLGSDDAIKVWLNGTLVHENNVARALAVDQDQVEVQLVSGENRLLMKIVNFAGGYGFAFDADQRSGSEFLRIVPLVVADSLTEEQATELQRYYRSTNSDEMRALAVELADLVRERDAFEDALPLSLVMEELAEPRETFRLGRGEYDKPREQVFPNVPDALPAMDEELARNRLGLAQWLVSEDQPLTARVVVNRLWLQMFGTGLVKTVEDFGSQGEWPSHPELLDWLAVEFVESGWDVKHMLRLIATSATYRQSARVTREMLERDPENRLLARGSRFRLQAEEIRDQALAASGLLVERLGGPSVMPYQPDGLWQAVAYPDSDTTTYMPEDGDGRYRRSMYTYWKRTSPPPNLVTFDAPTREACMVRRSRTNTPLQALVLLNDPQFVEAAVAMAGRVMRECETDEARVMRAFRLLTSREPDGDEVAVLLDLLAEERERYERNPAAADALVGEFVLDEEGGFEHVERAALSTVSSTIMVLDESLTR